MVLAATLIVGVMTQPAGGDQASMPEVRVAKADGFSYDELHAARPIVMFPVSTAVAGTEQAKRLSAALGRETRGGAFVSPARVDDVIRTRLLASAYDSLVTTMTTVQPASSFTVLAAMAQSFSARHALVPVSISEESAKDHYSFDIMFVLVDLTTGRPRIIMNVVDTVDGMHASDAALHDRIETQSIRAIIDLLHSHRSG